MPKQDIMDYVFETVFNTNPAILNQKLDELILEDGEISSLLIAEEVLF